MSFFRILLVLFLSIPILEIYLLLKVGSSIGVFPTVILVVATAVIGVWLLRIQGFATLAKAQQSLARGEVPAATMLEGVMLFIAGALLLTPGFFTDTIGFVFLIPMTRQWIARSIIKKNSINFSSFSDGQYSRSQVKTKQHEAGKTYDSSSVDIIEGEFISHDGKK